MINYCWRKLYIDYNMSHCIHSSNLTDKPLYAHKWVNDSYPVHPAWRHPHYQSYCPVCNQYSHLHDQIDVNLKVSKPNRPGQKSDMNIPHMFYFTPIFAVFQEFSRIFRIFCKIMICYFIMLRANPNSGCKVLPWSIQLC